MKILIQSAGVLTHYDPKKEMVITCDASPKGVGAVLYHVMPDGSEHPIVMASRSLSPAEKNYSQIDKEALGLIFRGKEVPPIHFWAAFCTFYRSQAVVGAVW